MNLRTFALPKDTDFSVYLSDAEKSVDALSDEELDLFEQDLEANIRHLVSSKPTLHLVGSTPKKRKLALVAWPAFSAVLVAALALFFLRTAEQIEEVPTWQTKGPAGQSELVSCAITIQQSSSGSAELSEAGYIVNRAAPVFLKTSCRQSLAVEVFEQGVWSTKLKVEAKEGYVVQKGEVLDLRPYIGSNLRIRSSEGISEEFILTDAP